MIGDNVVIIVVIYKNFRNNRYNNFNKEKYVFQLGV